LTEIINLSRVAAIDCGTNSIRLLIADISGGKFKEVLRDMEIVRLGQGVDENKSFHPDAINRTLAAVEKFKNQLAGKGVEKIRFCATSATRDAANRDLFIDGVRQILGVEVEVIPGEEEARLSFNGATKELLQSDAPFLVVDIGGGSTEFVYGNKEVEFAKSVDIGCVRMSERHLKSQPVEMGQVAQAIIDIDKAIAQAAAVVPIISKLGFMHPGRVDVITAGSLVLSRVMAATGATEFVASESDILDGMAWSLIN